MNFNKLKKAMKTIAFICLAVSSNLTHSENPFDADSKMARLGVIDENYRYTSVKKAAEFFRDGQNNFAESLPMKMNSGLTLTSVAFTPYVGVMNIEIDEEVSEELKLEFRKVIRLEKTVNSFCETIFKSKYMYVNNQQFEVNIKDSKGSHIDSIYLNKNTCQEPS
ncbi:hypothetical protein [Acinetobacter proteolyticus]|uniref:hypothetical protein n=1 Tax=Acinetobacter proteolyticus TaxID=1776741 RepID=UPI003D999B1E